MNRLPFDPAKFDERLAGFIAAAQLKVDENLKHYVSPHYTPPEPLTIKGGVRWVKIVKPDSVYVFVDRTTGNVHKAAGYKAPVTNQPRSNIFDEDFGVSGVNWHGAVYLR